MVPHCPGPAIQILVADVGWVRRTGSVWAVFVCLVYRRDLAKAKARALVGKRSGRPRFFRRRVSGWLLHRRIYGGIADRDKPADLERQCVDRAVVPDVGGVDRPGRDCSSGPLAWAFVGGVRETAQQGRHLGAGVGTRRVRSIPGVVGRVCRRILANRRRKDFHRVDACCWIAGPARDPFADCANGTPRRGSRGSARPGWRILSAIWTPDRSAEDLERRSSSDDGSTAGRWTRWRDRGSADPEPRPGGHARILARIRPRARRRTWRRPRQHDQLLRSTKQST